MKKSKQLRQLEKLEEEIQYLEGLYEKKMKKLENLIQGHGQRDVQMDQFTMPYKQFEIADRLSKEIKYMRDEILNLNRDYEKITQEASQHFTDCQTLVNIPDIYKNPYAYYAFGTDSESMLERRKEGREKVAWVGCSIKEEAK